jgi:hypothetical protein
VETFRLLATRGLREIELRLQLAQSVPAVAVPLKIDLHKEETTKLKRTFRFCIFAKIACEIYKFQVFFRVITKRKIRQQDVK